jgi:hypothetical protein
MNRVAFDRQRRMERWFEKMGTREPRCPCCPETHFACFEGHHLAGRLYHPFIVWVCVNDHRKLTDMQKDHPMHHPDADPLLQSVAHFLYGLADLLELATVLDDGGGQLRNFADALLERARELGRKDSVGE